MTLQRLRIPTLHLRICVVYTFIAEATHDATSSRWPRTCQWTTVRPRAALAQHVHTALQLRTAINTAPF